MFQNSSVHHNITQTLLKCSAIFERTYAITQIHNQEHIKTQSRSASVGNAILLTKITAAQNEVALSEVAIFSGSYLYGDDSVYPYLYSPWITITKTQNY